MATLKADKPNAREKRVARQDSERSHTGSAKLKDNPARDRRRRNPSRGMGEQGRRKRQSSSQVVPRRRRTSASTAAKRAVQTAQPVEVVKRTNSIALITLPKFFLLFGYLVGAMLVLICALDLLIGMPFSRASMLFDVGCLISGAILLYLSWDARDGCR